MYYKESGIEIKRVDWIMISLQKIGFTLNVQTINDLRVNVNPIFYKESVIVLSSCHS